MFKLLHNAWDAYFKLKVLRVYYISLNFANHQQSTSLLPANWNGKVFSGPSAKGSFCQSRTGVDGAFSEWANQVDGASRNHLPAFNWHQFDRPRSLRIKSTRNDTTFFWCAIIGCFSPNGPIKLRCFPEWPHSLKLAPIWQLHTQAEKLSRWYSSSFYHCIAKDDLLSSCDDQLLILSIQVTYRAIWLKFTFIANCTLGKAR